MVSSSAELVIKPAKSVVELAEENVVMKLLVILNALFVIGLSIFAGCVPIEPRRSAATSQPISPIQTGAVDVCAIPEGEDDQFRIISSVVVTVVIDGAVREVNVDRANVGIGVGMAATDTSTTTSQMLSEAMMSDPVRELLKEYELEDTLAHAFGPAQIGNVIRVAGKDIDIPDGFCVAAF